MRALVLRGLTVVFALGVTGTLVAHAALTSGCTRTEGATPEPARETPVTTASGATATAGSSAGNPAPPTPPPPIPASSVLNNPTFMPATKSGIVLRPQDFAAATPSSTAAPAQSGHPTPKPLPAQAGTPKPKTRAPH